MEANLPDKPPHDHGPTGPPDRNCWVPLGYKPTAKSRDLKPPSEWEGITGISVVITEGWQGIRSWPAKAYDEPITRLEFEARARESTHRSPT